MILLIGNKRYSSWSMRPWMLLKYFELPFEEKLIQLDTPTTDQEIAKYSPALKVPVLLDGSLAIWDSLAIAEYLHEKFPEKHFWPRDSRKRAQARAISCEMHSGFATMREILSHDVQKHLPGFDWSGAKADVERVIDIWRDCLREHGGPFLFGDFCVADAMFAPVVNRFVTYDVRGDESTRRYMDAMLNVPAHRQWVKEGKAETFRVPKYE